MLSNENILQAFVSERDHLRMELLEMERSLHRVVLAFLTVAGIWVTMYRDLGLELNTTSRDVLMFGLTQIEVFLGFFALALTANQNVHAGYIEALEIRINQLAGRVITAWESDVTPRFLFGLRGAFAWSVACLVSMLFATLLVFMRGSYHILGPRWGLFLFGAEFAALTAVSLFVSTQRKRVRDHAIRAFLRPPPDNVPSIHVA